MLSSCSIRRVIVTEDAALAVRPFVRDKVMARTRIQEINLRFWVILESFFLIKCVSTLPWTVFHYNNGRYFCLLKILVSFRYIW